MFSLLKSKNIKARQFKYKPRYYDEEKEEREARLKARRDKAQDPEATKSRISQTFRSKRNERNTAAKKSAFRTNLLLMSIIIILCWFVYVFLQNHLPTLMESWFS